MDRWQYFIAFDPRPTLLRDEAGRFFTHQIGKSAPDGAAHRQAPTWNLLLAMLLCVSFRSVVRMLISVLRVRARRVGMVCRLLMIPGLMMFGGLSVMLGGMNVMFCGLLVMIGSFLGHEKLLFLLVDDASVPTPIPRYSFQHTELVGEMRAPTSGQRNTPGVPNSQKLCGWSEERRPVGVGRISCREPPSCRYSLESSEDDDGVAESNTI